MINKSGIYCIRNGINNKIYVGSAINFKQRKHDHFKLLRNKSHFNYHLQKSFNKHGEFNFIFEILEVVSDKYKLINREQYWISKTNCLNKKYGYNICPNAGSTLGRKLNKKSLEKMIVSKTGKLMGKENPFYGKHHTKETKDRLSKSHTGKILSSEHKKNIGLAVRGRIISIITRKKISINNRKLSKPIVQLDLEDKPLKIWESAAKASKECCIDRSSVSRCAKNKQIKAGNFKWKYADNIMKDK